MDEGCFKNIKKVTQVISLLLTVLVSGSEIASADVLERWHWRNPVPQGNRLSSVTYGNGLFVAVGTGGAIVTSTNGTNWVARSLPVGLDVRSVVYGNNRFVAVGFGCSLTSTNGLEWSYASNTPPYQLYGVAFGTNTFVAVGNRIIRTSSDGITWTTRSSPFTSLRSIAYGNGMFIAVGYGGSVMTSNDGTNWVTRSSVNNNLDGITYANNIFVVIPEYNNNVLTTANGISWSYRFFGGTTISLYSVAHGSTGFVVMGDQMTTTSTDGTNWIRHNSLNPVEFDGITSANGIYVATGVGGAIQTSTDGINWASQTGRQNDLNAVTYGNGRFVAVGKLGTILSSSSGVSWETNNSGTSNYFNDVSYCNDRFIAVGIRYNGSGSMVRSTNGVNWVSCTGGEDNWMYGVTYGGGVYVAVGSGGTILTSTNADQWITQASGTTAGLYGIAFGLGQFIAVGDGGTMLSSTNGEIWTPRDNGSNPVSRIIFAGGMFVAVGGDYALKSTILTSTNGIDWQSQKSPTTYTLWDVAYGNGQFLALTSTSLPMILHSSDGLVWKTSKPSNVDWPLCKITYGASTFVVAGNGCGILQSDSTAPAELSLEKLQDGSGVVVNVSGEVGRNYRLQYRSDLLGDQWNDMLTFTNDHPTVALTNLTSDWQRFYRVTSP